MARSADNKFCGCAVHQRLTGIRRPLGQSVDGRHIPLLQTGGRFAVRGVMFMPRALGAVVQFRTAGDSLARDKGEARVSPRRRVLKGGVVACIDGRLIVPCAVRDMSETGARIKVQCPVSVPDTFELFIELDGLEAACQVVWRKGEELGVKFLGAPRKVREKRIQVVVPVCPPRTRPLHRSPKPGAKI
jgi:hypothetical protein